MLWCIFGSQFSGEMKEETVIEILKLIGGWLLGKTRINIFTKIVCNNLESEKVPKWQVWGKFG